MGVLDEVLGALLIGAYINCSMYALELCCLYRYYSRHNRDHIFLKGVILAMSCCDTANTILQCITVYLMAVTHYGDEGYLAKGTVFFALHLICQLFLVWRFFMVSKNYLVSALLCLPPLAAWISAIYATVALVVYTSLEDRLRVVQIGTAWLTLEASSDITISLALIILLGRYTRQTTFVATQSLLKRLMFNAAQTGAVTASIAVGMLMAFLLSKTSNINTGFSYCLGRAYALTLLINLLSRPTSETGDQTATRSHSSSSGRGTRKNVFGVSTYRLQQDSMMDPIQQQASASEHFNQDIGVAREITVKIDQVYPDDKEDLSRSLSDQIEDQYELGKMPERPRKAAI